MNNKGISLISLIITIIVIIILAAIVIFTGLGTPDSANFAHFCQDCDNVYSAVLNEYADLKVQHATANETRTDEQIYIEVATGNTTTQYSAMSGLDVKNVSGELQTTDTYCQNISSTASKVKSSLAEVRESKNAWYVAQNGQVFNATGYTYKNGDTTYTYFSANARTATELSATDATYENRAKKIAEAICGVSGDISNISGVPDADGAAS